MKKVGWFSTELFQISIDDNHDLFKSMRMFENFLETFINVTEKGIL